MDTNLDALIEQQTPRAISDLQKLLSFDTSLPPGHGYPEISEWLGQQVALLGFQTESVSIPESLWQQPQLGFDGSRINLVARRSSGKPKLSIYMHTDVVPPGPGWTVPPFAGIVRHGRVFGRGAADMKGAIASLLAALRALGSASYPLAFDPILLFCTDEEGGTFPGIRYLAEQGYIQGHLLCLDGQAAPRRWAGCCGMVDWKVTVIGKGGHSGDALQTGANAIESAVPILQSLIDLKTRVERRQSKMPAAPWENEPFVHARLNVTVIRGGTKPNVIPGECDIWINRRYLPEEKLDEILNEIESTVRANGVALRVAGVLAHLPPVRDPLGPHWPNWELALLQGFGYQRSDFVLYGASSSSDMGWVQTAGVNEILLGGLSRRDANVHGADEWTSISDLMALAKSIAIYLTDQEASQI